MAQLPEREHDRTRVTLNRCVRCEHCPGINAEMRLDSNKGDVSLCKRAAAISAEGSDGKSDDVNPSSNCQHGNDFECLFDLICYSKQFERAPDEPFHRHQLSRIFLNTTSIDWPELRSSI